MKRVLLGLLEIVVVSLPLTWLWMEWGRDAYALLFRQLAIPIYGYFGHTEILPNAARDRFIHYLPFLVLMIVTPRIPWMRRILGTLVGFVVLFAFQVLFVYVDHISTVGARQQRTQEGFETFFPLMLLSDSLPLILWALIANQFVRDIASKIFEGAATNTQGSAAGEGTPTPGGAVVGVVAGAEVDEDELAPDRDPQDP
ncbi:MAG: hypothetical protein JRH19_27515 [Deltaproteobacteria bacterium]|nr:hypothetical protein [Deltaproteobacteria bacterium]